VIDARAKLKEQILDSTCDDHEAVLRSVQNSGTSRRFSYDRSVFSQ
jgi:hypothetical protein